MSSTGPRLSIIPGWVAADPRLRGKDLAVLCMLGNNANTRHGWCRRSQVKLAAALCCSRSTVQASINRLVEIGAIERREVVVANGRDSAHWYRVIYDSVVESSAFSAWDDDDAKEFDPNSEHEDMAPPAGIPAPPAGPGSAPPAGSGPAPINDCSSTPPAQREEREARERGSDGSGEDDPKELLRRVKALELGRNGNSWPGALSSSTQWAVLQFTKLSPEERRQAEDRRDAYLAAVGRKAVALGVYLRDRKFLDIDTKPLAEARATAHSGRLVVPVFGPAFAAARAWTLLEGPVDFELPADLREKIRMVYENKLGRNRHAAAAYLAERGIDNQAGELVFPSDFEAAEWLRRVQSEGFPDVNRMHDAAKDRGHVSVPVHFDRMQELCEAVPVGSAAWKRWQEEHERRGWPFVPTPERMKVVWFPKGGPEGLDEFKRAAEAAMSARVEDDAA